MAAEEILLKLEELRKSTSDVSLEGKILKLQHRVVEQMSDEWGLKTD